MQLWVALDPYDATDDGADKKGRAARLAKEKGARDVFLMGDKETEKMLRQSIENLARDYSVSAVVLRTDTAKQAGEPADKQKAFYKLIDGLSFRRNSPQQLVVRWQQEGELLSRKQLATLVKEEKLQTVALQGDDTPGWFEAVDSYRASGVNVVVEQPKGSDGSAALFAAAQSSAFRGGWLGRYPDVLQNPAVTGALSSAMQPLNGALPAGFDVPQQLQINYPLAEDVITAAQNDVYIMGNSNPAAPLSVNGQNIERNNSSGLFGVLVPLQTGNNTVVFSNGGDELTHTIYKPAGMPAQAAGGALPHDDTAEAAAGQTIEITGEIASLLQTPGSDSAINGALYKGARAVVHASVETKRHDAKMGCMAQTWAYQLADGNYVLARHCAILDDETTADEDGAFNIKEVLHGRDDGGEWLDFIGDAPAAFTTMEGSTLALTLYNTTLSLPQNISSPLIKSVRATTFDGGVTVRVETDNIWGFQVTYQAERMRLYLKKPPVFSGDVNRPLDGVTVMLDAGHGGDDIGAPGIMGGDGPNEKDVNLRLALTTQRRFEQLGATVIMTRSDDTALSTVERLALLIEKQPDFFISLHHNAAEMDQDGTKESGMEAYYYAGETSGIPPAKAFAETLTKTVGGALNRPQQPASWSYYIVTRSHICPAVLMEYGFMINPLDLDLALSDEGLYAAACGTADAVVQNVPQ